MSPPIPEALPSAAHDEFLGGLVVLRPRPFLHAAPGLTQGLTLMSDLHVGASNCDEEAIKDDLREAKRNGDRILLNGDVFDAIVPADKKRYSPTALHPRLQGRDDVINGAVDMAYELLKPYAESLDFASTGNHECHSEDTECLTKDGWVSWPSVTENHELATVDPVSGAVAWQKPLRLFSYDYDGDLVRLSAKGLDCLVTPNHRMYVKKGDIAGFVSAADLDLVHRKKLLLCPGATHESRCELSDEEVRLLGWAVTDAGWCGSTITFSQRPEKAHLIRHLLDAVGADYAETVRRRNIKVVCGKALKSPPKPSHEFRVRKCSVRDFLEEHVSKTREVPPVVYGMSGRQFELFLDAVTEANGTRHAGSTVTLYGMPGQLSGLQAACAFHGYRTSYVVDNRGDSRLYVNRNPFLSCGSIKRTAVPYKGKVYCAEVPNSTLVTRYKGKVLVSGNSSSSKNGAVDPLSLLVQRLNDYLAYRNSPHEVLYGGYSGLAVYDLGPRKKRGDRKPRPFVVYYHHGYGKGAKLSSAAAQYGDAQHVEGADVVWMGHLHCKLNAHVTRVGVPEEGDEPLVREVRFVRTGAYMRLHRGQPSRDALARGRRSNYAADKGLPAHGVGGARVLLTFRDDLSFAMKVVQ